MPETELVLFSAEDYFSSLLEEISSAQKTIDFETYIFEGSPIGLSTTS